MTPVSVKEAPQKEEDNKNKKKGLLAKLLSLVGRGGGAASAAAGAGAASTGLGVAQVAAAGATAGGSWLTYLTTTKGLAAVLGGGAMLVSVGMLGSQMFGGPSLKGVGGQGFSSQQRATRNVDQADETQSHLGTFNEHIKAQGEGDDGGGGSDKQGAAKAGVSDAAPGAAVASAPRNTPKDAYGNPLSAMKSGFGESNNFGGGAGGGVGGGGSKAGAVGVGGPNGLQLTGAGARGNSTSMKGQSQNITASARSGRAVTGASGGLNQLKATAGLSRAASLTSNYQTAGYTAGRAFHGTTGGSSINSAIGANGGIQTGAGLTGEAANLAGNPNNISKNITPPAAPVQGQPNKSCSSGNPVAQSAGDANMTQDQYNTLKQTCADQQELVMNLLWLGGAALVAMLAIAQVAKIKPYGTIAAVALAAVVVAVCVWKILECVAIMQRTSSLMMFAILEMAGFAFVAYEAIQAAYTGWVQNTPQTVGPNNTPLYNGPNGPTTLATNPATGAANSPMTESQFNSLPQGAQDNISNAFNPSATNPNPTPPTQFNSTTGAAYTPPAPAQATFQASANPTTPGAGTWSQTSAPNAAGQTTTYTAPGNAAVQPTNVQAAPGSSVASIQNAPPVSPATPTAPATPASGGFMDSTVGKIGTGVATSVATSTITGALTGSSASGASSNSTPAAQNNAKPPSGGGSSAAAAPAAAPADATPAAAPAAATGPAQPVATNAGTGIDASDEMAQLFGGGSGSGTTTV